MTARKTSYVRKFLVATGLASYYLISHAAIDPMDPDLVKARIKPVGQVNVMSTATSASPANATPSPSETPDSLNAKTIYDTKCMVCHATGVAGAPKLGDQNAWKPRLAQGMQVLLQHVKQGYKAMPPKGTCMECTDTQLQAAINYLIKGK